MNKEQQIEEMVKFLLESNAFDCEECDKCGLYRCDEDCCEDICFADKEAKLLYNAGYRKQYKSEWINVKDRLPEKEQVVLCCLGLVMNVYTYKGDNTWEDDYGYWQKDEPITHWMSLPELPKN